MEPTLDYLEHLARQAGEILREGFNGKREIYHKGVVDLVTDIDQRSEAFLLAEIQKSFPEDRIIAEESGGVGGQDCCVWYIDPLDGTVNYAHGIPIFSVSIAYTVGGEIQLGVVYDPVREECFRAQQGKGAWLNSKRLRVSGIEDINQGVLVTGFPYDIRTHQDNNLDHFAQFALASQGIRRLGSAALDLCYVAAGRFDGYWELRLAPWDLAAGALIAAEAGARVTDLEGGHSFLEPPYSIVAAPPGIHARMLDILKKG